MKPTRILLSDDLYALEEEGEMPAGEPWCLVCGPGECKPYNHPPVTDVETDTASRIRVLGNDDHEPGLERWRAIAPGTEPPRETSPSPLLGMLAAGISGAVVGAVLVLVLT